MPVKGKRILKALRELIAPSTPQEIAKHIAKKRKRQTDLKKLEEEVIEALASATTFGNVEMCNGHYYNLEDTKRQLKLIEKEENKKRKLPPNLVLKNKKNKKKPPYSPPIKRKRRLISTTNDQPNSSVTAQAAHSMPSNSVTCVASNENKSNCSADAKYELAMGAEMTKAIINVIIDKIAANFSHFNVPSLSLSKDQRTSGTLRQNLENPIPTAANKTVKNNISEREYREAVAVAKSELDEIVDDINFCVLPKNIDANSCNIWLQSDSSESTEWSTDSSQSSGDDMPSKMSVQNYLKEQNVAHGSRDRASKYESPRVMTLVEMLERINVYGPNNMESAAQNMFFSNSLLRRDTEDKDNKDIVISEPSNSLPKEGQVNFEKDNNAGEFGDYISLSAMRPTGVEITNPYLAPTNNVTSVPEDINNISNSNELCQRCWFEKINCKCRRNH
ncbi:uncharacterized protein LOC119662067 [Teleopsis dalmanni]|uniref:uncharacterized protein LOC119662067 n=1 Tax=Teleopsis dalmanni TaxID=139649 RepID=UPI0018CCE89B|nr:uncharacterized protein LOC119662067 [Teleopsis dalmanni]